MLNLIVVCMQHIYFILRPFLNVMNENYTISCTDKKIKFSLKEIVYGNDVNWNDVAEPVSTFKLLLTE